MTVFSSFSQTSEAPDKKAKKSKDSQVCEDRPDERGEGEGEGQTVEVEGEKVLTLTVDRGPDSSVHTALEHLHLGAQVGNRLLKCDNTKPDTTYSTTLTLTTGISH